MLAEKSRNNINPLLKVNIDLKVQKKKNLGDIFELLAKTLKEDVDNLALHTKPATCTNAKNSMSDGRRSQTKNEAESRKT